MHVNGHFFFTLALHVIFGGQTVDSHVMILVTGHFLHHGGIFAQRINDVGIESGTMKVTGLVLFQQIQGSLIGADNEMFAVKAVAQFQISFVLGGGRQKTKSSRNRFLMAATFSGFICFLPASSTWL
jgi:hypothetical protein